MSTDRENLKASLSAMDFPASKQQLVEHAQTHGADEGTLRGLRALPLGDYDNFSDVLGAVPFDKATEEGQSGADKAQQQRHNTQAGLSELQTETPSNPIVEELGENRGS